jgi:hypothetical protein
MLAGLNDPIRFTVYDFQASASLIAIGYLERRHRESWSRYLAGCREVAKESGHKLRTVDHALFTANGRLTLPGVRPHLIGELSVALAHWDGRGPTNEETFAAGSEMASAIVALLAWNGSQQ